MEKIKFKSKVFQYVLFGFILSLMAINLINLISGVTMALLPLIFQAIVLALILLRNKYAKILILAWAIFTMVGPGLIIFGNTLNILIGEASVTSTLIGNIFKFSIALITLILANKCIEISKENKEINSVEKSSSVE